MAEPAAVDPSLLSQRKALLSSLRADITDQRVLDAFARVPRERFVTDDLRQAAYEDHPLPIGHGQTISQPRMVGLMLQELALTGDDHVLEIGTGSGYQTALLAELVARVTSVELIPDLAQIATQRLADLGYNNVEVHVAGPELGWPASAPYSAILVAAASPRIPQVLVDQLAAGGRMVIPVGSRDSQDLMLVQSRPEGLVVTRKGGCRFVPLIGPEAYSLLPS